MLEETPYVPYLIIFIHSNQLHCFFSCVVAHSLLGTHLDMKSNSYKPRPGWLLENIRYLSCFDKKNEWMDEWMDEWMYIDGWIFLTFPSSSSQRSTSPLTFLQAPEIAPIAVPIEALRVENPKLEREREREERQRWLGRDRRRWCNTDLFDAACFSRVACGCHLVRCQVLCCRLLCSVCVLVAFFF